MSNPTLDLTDGGTFEIAVFSAQRQTKASAYQVMLAGFDASRSVCTPTCSQGCSNQCDPNTVDCYNQCTMTCERGPYCGDGIVQPEHEQCDPGP